eukprot:CCRYP_011179-RA/>CCRYP_011179-RA protein AED:0.32 eAED:0.33 QI:0/0/0/1/0/0/2/0/551
MTIQLPEHRFARLLEILDSIPPTQKRTSVKKWHKVLGELRSMSLALPDSRNIFSSMQTALSNMSGTRAKLNKGFHHALEGFRWMHDNIASRSNCIAELVPLDPVAEGHHDASGSGAGGIWFSSATLVSRSGHHALKPLLWCQQWPDYIKQRLVTEVNPNGTITNSDLVLAGGLLHLEALTQAFDITERTVLSKGDNFGTTFWEQKGSTSSDKPPAYLLGLFECRISTLDPVTTDTFRRDFRAAQETVQAGVIAGNASQAITAWTQWTNFTTELGLDPFLQALQDKVPVLQVFVLQVRLRELAANGHPIRARSAEAYVRHIAQTFLHMGAQDPRLTSIGQIDFCLQGMVAAWKKKDSPPCWVKPVPIRIIRHIAYLARHSTSSNSLLVAVVDMIIIAFFFLLRPGEYTHSNQESTPFRLSDVQLFIGQQHLNLLHDFPALILQARFASLIFTDQKNGVRGEVIGLGCSGDTYLCLVKAIIRRVLYLQLNSAPPDVPLARLFNSNSGITASVITSTLTGMPLHCWVQNLGSYHLTYLLTASMHQSNGPPTGSD